MGRKHADPATRRWKIVEEVIEVVLVVLVIVVSCHQHTHAQHLALSTRCFVDPQYEPSG